MLYKVLALTVVTVLNQRGFAVQLLPFLTSRLFTRQHHRHTEMGSLSQVFQNVAACPLFNQQERKHQTPHPPFIPIFLSFFIPFPHLLLPLPLLSSPPLIPSSPLPIFCPCYLPAAGMLVDSRGSYLQSRRQWGFRYKGIIQAVYPVFPYCLLNPYCPFPFTLSAPPLYGSLLSFL